MVKCGKCNKCRKGKNNHQDGKHDEVCKTRCDTNVDLSVDVSPHVRHTQHVKRDTSFEIDLDFKTKPRCCIRSKCMKRTGRCSHSCTFAVDVDLDIDCKSRVSRPCSPNATFDLDVDVDALTHCKMAKGCHDRDH